jgi:uncharacterized membrane-anchored protein
MTESPTPVHLPSAWPQRQRRLPPDESKVPHVTLALWIIKICATTLDENGGDVLSMTLNPGYAVSTVIFFGFF